MTEKTSKDTWRAVYSMFGPYAIANLFMLVAFIFLAVAQPNLDDENTYWALVVGAVLMLAAGGFLVAGLLRFKGVHISHKADRRRIAAGLPLEPEEPQKR
ncbi:hypothetical protein [Arthrobacter sp. 9MFCol3.1]|uniref:hypothetical protein n=1 Tax=Arthrobacter sp. 9MFCol3.1 TaxID=1150398 RepID=UPI00047D671F|nr:hypothetical protein [Arthrobacter sp. 9MFCol3.1]